MRACGFPLVLLTVHGIFPLFVHSELPVDSLWSDVFAMTQQPDGTMKVSNPCADDPLTVTYNVDANGVTKSKRP